MVTDCSECPLRKLDTFETLKGEELAFMRRFKSGELNIGAGTPLLMEGSNSPQLYTALKGMGLRYKILPNGNRQVLNFVFPGDFIGLQAGVMGEMQHSVEAVTPMVLRVFDRSDLWSLFKNQPHRSYDLTWLAAMEEHFLSEILASVGQLSAMERISWGLLRFYKRAQESGLARDGQCPMPFKQQDLADALGLSLVHTNKTLMRLKERQIVSWRGGVLHILDREELESIALEQKERPSVRALI